MPISFSCNECKTPVRVNDNLAGKHVRCRKCGGLMRVPGEALPAPRDNSAVIKWAAVGLCAILLSAGGIVAWKYLQKPARVARTAPPPADPTTPVESGVETPATPETPATEPKVSAKSGLTAPPPAPKLSASPMGKALLSAPESCVATGALMNPAGLLEAAKANMDRLAAANPSGAGMMNLLIQQAQAQAGIDLNNPRTLGINGLDLTQPITVAVLGMLPEKNEPAGIVVGVGLTDAAQFRESVKALHAKAGRTVNALSATPEIFGLDESSCVAIDGKEAFLIATAAERLQQQALVFLKVRKERRMQETENMTVTMNNAGLGGDFAVYVDLPRILNSLPEKSPITTELKGAAMSVNATAGSGWFLQLDRAGVMLPLLKPGPSPRKVLERFNAPLVTVAGTLSDPVRLLQQFMHSTNNGKQLIEIDNELRAKTEMGLIDLSDLLKNSSAGLMLFKGADRVPFSGVLFIQPETRDPKQLAQLQKMMEKVMAELSGLWSRPDSPIAIPLPTVSVIDGVVFATTSPQLLTNYQLTTNPVSQSSIGADDFFMLEYRAGEMMEHLKRINPDMVKSQMPIDRTALMNVALKRTPDGVKMYSSNSQIDVATVSVIAAIAIPSLLRSRMAANETAALAFCRKYLDAQDAYKRQDRDNDGVAEYAQSLGGPAGLTTVLQVSMQSSENKPMPLLDPKYAKAEGNPKDATTPAAGYCMKILKAQGDRAKSGRIAFFAGKDMVAGHAIIVYPKVYDSTGRSTFICNQDGVIYQSDLGVDTHSIVELMTEFNPGPGWRPAE